MAVEIITMQDLCEFKKELIADLLKLMGRENSEPKKWLRSQEVRKLLNISHGTIQNMRINGSLPYSKIGTIYFYSYDEVMKLLEKNRPKHTSIINR